MSKGIGRSQALLLRAMLSLEVQHLRLDGRTGHRWWHVSSIVNRALVLSPELRARHAADEEAFQAWQAARDAEMKASAEAGCKLAREWLMLGAVLRASARRRKGRYRPQERQHAADFIETHINPSRALASLAKRGLIGRLAQRGGGIASLTEAGRDAGRREIMKRLSVGSTCVTRLGDESHEH